MTRGVAAGPTRGATLREAAEVLGISKEAVRKRVKRGTLPSSKGEDGRVYVYLPAGEDAGTDAGGVRGQGEAREHGSDDVDLGRRDELVAHLREQLTEEREARRRADTIIAQLAQANAEQARTIGALEAPSEPTAPRESPQGAAEEPEGVDAQATGGPRPAPQGGPERRSGWRRWFGFE